MIVAYPYPPNNPVIRRRIFVDSFIFNFCINQSQNIMAQKTMLIIIFNFKFNKKAIIANI